MYGSAPSTASSPVQHDGQPLPPDDDYPVAPDGAIGRVISSASNRTRTGCKPMAPQEKGMFIVVPILTVILGGLISFVLTQQLVRKISM